MKLDEYPDEESVSLAQPRTSPYPKAEVINLNDEAQVQKLRGTRIGVQGVGAAAIVARLIAQGIDAVEYVGGKTTVLPMLPDCKAEFARQPKEKAQWKRERSGRR